MTLAILVAHALAEDALDARLLVRNELLKLDMKVHLGELVQVDDVPQAYFKNGTVRVTRFSAGL